MEKENLLKFFKEKNELVNQIKAFTSLDLECVNSFNFTISNQRDIDGCAVEIKSIKNLIGAVKDYYSKTNKNHQDFITYSPNFKKERNMFVIPILLTI